MKQVTILGIDLAKNVIQLHGRTAHGSTAFRKRLRPSSLGPFVAQFPKCLIAMEACSMAHHWARKFEALGHQVKLLPAQHVRPFVRSNKDDAADAEAIAEAATRPNIRAVPVKTPEQLDFQMLLRVRERLVKNRVALANEMRAIAAERGTCFPKGMAALKDGVLAILRGTIENVEILQECKTTLADLHSEIIDLEERLRVIDERLARATEQHPKAKRLLEMRGVGQVITAATLAGVPDPTVFRNGRQFAAWLGLVPRHTGTGGRNVNGTLSKRGNAYLRWLLIQGAQSILRKAEFRSDPWSKWCAALKAKKPNQQAAVAIANKMARIIWTLLIRDEKFDPRKASFVNAA